MSVVEYDTPTQTSDQPAPTVDSGTLGRQLLRNSLALLGSQMVSWLLTFGTNLVVPRYLGPATAGSLYFAASIATLALIGAGLSSTMLAVKVSARTPEQTGRWLANGLFIRGAMSSLGLAILLIVLHLLGYTPQSLWLVVLVGLGGILGTFVDLIVANYQGLNWISRSEVISTIARLAGTGALLALVFWQRSVEELVISGIVVAVAQVAVQIGLLWRRGHRLGGLSLPMMRAMAAESLPFLVAGVALIVYFQINPVLLGYLADAQAVAWYSVPSRLLGTSLVVPTVILGAAYPILAQLYATDPAAMLVQARRVLAGILVSATPMALALALYGTPIIVLLYGEAYAPAGPVLQIFGLVLIAVYLNTFAARLLMAMDRERVWSIVMVAATVLTVPLSAGLILWTKSFGQASIGAALGLLGAEAAMTVAALLVLGRYQLGRICLVVLAKGGLAALAAGAGALVLMPVNPILSGGVAMIIYAVACWYTRIVPAAEVRRALELAGQWLPARLRRRLAPLQATEPGP